MKKIYITFKDWLRFPSFFFDYNIIINQKKFYIYNVKLITNKVILSSRSKEELNNIDIEELAYLNIEENYKYLIDNLKYFMNFEGFAMIFTFKAINIKNEIKDIYGIVFFNLSNWNTYDIRVFRIYYETEVNIMIYILKKYLQNGEFEITVNWINMFLDKVDKLNKEKKFETFKMYIDLHNKFRFIPLLQYEKLVKVVENLKILDDK